MVNQQAKRKRLAAQAEVFTRSVLQQGETKDQPGRPQNQQENQRQAARSSRENSHGAIGFECGGQSFATESKFADRTRR